MNEVAEQYGAEPFGIDYEKICARCEYVFVVKDSRINLCFRCWQEVENPEDW